MATKRHITERDIEAARNLKRIYEHRKYGTERMTQRKLADLMGFKQQVSVSQYMNAKIPMSLETIAKFAHHLNVDPTEIRPDFFEQLPVNRTKRPFYSVVVKKTLSGEQPLEQSIQTTIKEVSAVNHYAVKADTPIYRKAGIREDAMLIIAEGVEPLVDDDVYVELADGTSMLATYMGTDSAESQHMLRELSTGEIRQVAFSDLTTFDVIVGVENPKRDRKPR